MLKANCTFIFLSSFCFSYFLKYWDIFIFFGMLKKVARNGNFPGKIDREWAYWVLVMTSHCQGGLSRPSQSRYGSKLTNQRILLNYTYTFTITRRYIFIRFRSVDMYQVVWDVSLDRSPTLTCPCIRDVSEVYWKNLKWCTDLVWKSEFIIKPSKKGYKDEISKNISNILKQNFLKSDKNLKTSIPDVLTCPWYGSIVTFFHTPAPVLLHAYTHT